MAPEPLPTVPLGAHRVTRLIVGGNPFCGNSHLDAATSTAMAAYHTPENVVASLQRCQDLGIDTVQARGDYHRVLHWLELHRRQGGALQWIAQTASEMADVFQNIRILAAAGAIGIYHHGSQTDRFWREGRIDACLDYLRCMRDCGVQVGLGTHIPEVIEHAEDRGWDVDFYMACLYNLSRTERQSALVTGRAADAAQERFDAADPPRMVRTIQATPRPCLAFKILAAGRRCATQDEVAAAFRYAYEHIKPQDAVVVGVYQEHADQIALNVAHARAALAAAASPEPAA